MYTALYSKRYITHCKGIDDTFSYTDKTINFLCNDNANSNIYGILRIIVLFVHKGRVSAKYFSKYKFRKCVVV